MHAMTIADLAVKFLVFNLVNVGSVAGDCPPTFIDGGQVCYDVVEVAVSFSEADTLCKKKNGKLARREIEEEANRDGDLEKLLDKGKRYFTGNLPESLGTEYPTGKSIFLKLLHLIDSFGARNHCNVLSYVKKWVLGHIVCSDNKRFYICEYNKANFMKTVTTKGTAGGNTTTGDVNKQKVPPKRKKRRTRQKSPENKYVKLLCKSLYVKDPPVFKTRLPSVTVCTRECISHKNCTTVNFNTETGECRGHSADSKTGMKDQVMWELWTVPVQ